MTRTRARPGLALLIFIGACRDAGPPSAATAVGDLRIDRGFAFEPITTASGAAYFRVRNAGGSPDTLLEVTSPVARNASVHGSSMAHLNVLPIPAGAEVELKPGATHLMLTDFAAVPKAGDSMAITLRFARAGSVTLQLPVRRYGQ